MRIFKQAICYTTITAFAFTSSSCDKCQLLALPDLIVEAIDIVSGTNSYSVGKIIDFGISIYNVVDSGACETAPAESTSYDFDVYYDTQPITATNPGKKVASASYNQVGVSAGQKLKESQKATPNVAGYYAFVSKTDAPEKIKERNETNNTGTGGNLKSGRVGIDFSGSIEVKENQSYRLRIAKGEKIEYFTFEPSPNLIKSTSVVFDPQK